MIRISGVKDMMTDDDEGSVVTVVTTTGSVVSVATRVEPAEFREVEDEVDQEEGAVEEEDDDDQSGDFQFGGNHPMRAGTLLSNRFNDYYIIFFSSHCKMKV